MSGGNAAAAASVAVGAVAAVAALFAAQSLHENGSARTAEASKDGAITTTTAASPASAAASTYPSPPPTPTQSPADEGDGAHAAHHQCPICIEAIEPAESVMRCSHHHYCHEGCLMEWMRSRSGATCPMCRGPIEVHAARLSAYLEGGAAHGLDADERNLLQKLVDRAKARGVEWESVRKEDLVRWGVAAAGLGWGVYSGYKGRSWSVADEAAFELAPTSTKVSMMAGWAIGTVAKIATQQRRGTEPSRSAAERDGGGRGASGSGSTSSAAESRRRSYR